MTDFLDSFLDDYFAEAEEHLAVIRRALLMLEHSVGQRSHRRGNLEELFRSFHSLKGIAGMVDHRETEALAHELESYLRALREGDAVLTTAGMDLLIKGAGALEASIAARRANAPPRRHRTGRRARLQTARDRRRRSARRRRDLRPATAANWLCVFTPSPALIARGVNVDAVRARLREHRRDRQRRPDHHAAGRGRLSVRRQRRRCRRARSSGWQADGMVVHADHRAGRSGARPEDAGGRARRRDPVVRPLRARRPGAPRRVDADDRQPRDPALAADRHGRARSERHLPPAHYRAIEEDAEAIERELRELREGVMRVRLVPIGEIFRRMPFVVRDLARDSGRSVNVVLSGQDTKIDKFLVERMMDPVLHLVRNAVSHGIETPAEREAAGKPPAATLAPERVARPAKP